MERFYPRKDVTDATVRLEGSEVQEVDHVANLGNHFEPLSIWKTMKPDSQNV